MCRFHFFCRCRCRCRFLYITECRCRSRCRFLFTCRCRCRYRCRFHLFILKLGISSYNWYNIYEQEISKWIAMAMVSFTILNNHHHQAFLYVVVVVCVSLCRSNPQWATRLQFEEQRGTNQLTILTAAELIPASFLRLKKSSVLTDTQQR